MPPGTTLNNTPGPTNRGPGGGGPWGTETVDPRCATSVACGPNQTAAPGGPSLLNNQNIGPVTEKPRPGGPATAVEADRARLNEQLTNLTNLHQTIVADTDFRSVLANDPAAKEYYALLANTDGGASARESTRAAIANVQADITYFEQLRRSTQNADEFERLGQAIASAEGMLLTLREEARKAEAQRAQRIEELGRVVNNIKTANEQRWREEVARSERRIEDLRVSLGLSTGSRVQQLIHLMTPD
jgi:hypothetical protein